MLLSLNTIFIVERFVLVFYLLLLWNKVIICLFRHYCALFCCFICHCSSSHWFIYNFWNIYYKYDVYLMLLFAGKFIIVVFVVWWFVAGAEPRNPLHWCNMFRCFCFCCCCCAITGIPRRVPMLVRSGCRTDLPIPLTFVQQVSEQVTFVITWLIISEFSLFLTCYFYLAFPLTIFISSATRLIVKTTW